MTNLNLLSATLKDVVHALTSGQTTSVKLVTAYLDQIERNNHKGLGLHAVIDAAPRQKVLKCAAKLDQERLEGKPRSVLHGTPILVKDALSTSHELGMRTTNGSLAFEGSWMTQNAKVVQSLIDAGMIIIAKANLTVFGNFYGSNNPHGWSPAGGQTVSAYGRDVSPAGSSAGSAVGLSAGFGAAAIGVEACGSTMSPSRQAGLYAIKPTGGSVSRDGLICLSLSADVICPIGKSTWDVAALLEHMYEPKTSFLEGLHGTSIGNFKLGILRKNGEPWTTKSPIPPTPELKVEVASIFAEAVEKLQNAGANFVDPADIEDVDCDDVKARLGDHFDAKDTVTRGARNRTFMVEQWEASRLLGKYRQGSQIHSLQDLINWNEKNPEKAFLDPSGPPQDELLREAQEVKGREDEVYRASKEIVRTFADNVDRIFDDNQLDALLIAGGVGFVGTHAPAFAQTGGFPIVTFPLALTSAGEPYGAFLLGKRGEDAKLLSVMAACEKIIDCHPVPPIEAVFAG